VLVSTAGLCAWIALWALGASGLDGFLIVPVLLLAAAMSRVTSPLLVRGQGGSKVGLVKRAWVFAGVLVGMGLALWLAALLSTNDVPARLSDLGSGLLGGAVVAFAVFSLERRSEQARELENVRLSIGLQQELSHADLTGRDLSHTVFNGKTLDHATFVNAKLRHAGFVNCDLKDANFANADLTKAVFSLADLEGATFAGADLTAAIFTDARSVENADFATACYRDGKSPTFSVPTPSHIREGCS
jgi:Pentapeptide repeats (9 copies)